MPIEHDKSPAVTTTGIDPKWFALTQLSVLAPMAALVLCPPAAIPLAAVGAGVWKSYLKRTANPAG